jgi:VRR-NUC domain
MPSLSLIPSEDKEQIALATWLTKQGIIFYAVPNGGRRNLREAVKLKRMGVSPGVPDICIPIPSGDYHGCYLELKRQKGGRLSPEQAGWLQYLRNQNYYADMAEGFEEAKKIVLYYLGFTKPAA